MPKTKQYVSIAKVAPIMLPEVEKMDFQAVKVELQEGKQGLPVLKIWGLYKDDKGDLQHTGTKFGARNIQFDVDAKTLMALQDAIATMVVAEKNYVPSPQANSKVETVNIADLSADELEKLLASKRKQEAQEATIESLEEEDELNEDPLMASMLTQLHKAGLMTDTEFKRATKRLNK